MLDIGAIGEGDTWVLTPLQLETVFRNAARGDVVVYAVGDLGYTRDTSYGTEWANANRTAKYAYNLYLTGEADLTQKRLGRNKFEYRAAKK